MSSTRSLRGSHVEILFVSSFSRKWPVPGSAIAPQIILASFSPGLPNRFCDPLSLLCFLNAYRVFLLGSDVASHY